MPEPKIGLRLEQAATFGNGDVGGVLHWADDRAYLYRMPAAAWSALGAAIAAVAELEAVRPVVEAAVAYSEARYTSGAGAAGDLLVAAVDLYRSATSDNPSTTEEKP